MEIFLYILAAAVIAGAVVLWHVYDTRISSWVKGGPIEHADDSLSVLADKMHAAKADFLVHASKLETKLATAKADVETATAKVVAASAPKVQP